MHLIRRDVEAPGSKIVLQEVAEFRQRTDAGGELNLGRRSDARKRHQPQHRPQRRHAPDGRRFGIQKFIHAFSELLEVAQRQIPIVANGVIFFLADPSSLDELLRRINQRRLHHLPRTCLRFFVQKTLKERWRMRNAAEGIFPDILEKGHVFAANVPIGRQHPRHEVVSKRVQKSFRRLHHREPFLQSQPEGRLAPVLSVSPHHRIRPVHVHNVLAEEGGIRGRQGHDGGGQKSHTCIIGDEWRELLIRFNGSSHTPTPEPTRRRCAAEARLALLIVI